MKSQSVKEHIKSAVFCVRKKGNNKICIYLSSLYEEAQEAQITKYAVGFLQGMWRNGVKEICYGGMLL